MQVTNILLFLTLLFHIFSMFKVFGYWRKTYLEQGTKFAELQKEYNELFKAHNIMFAQYKVVIDAEIAKSKGGGV